MFIELNKYNVQNERRDGKAVMEATPGFLTWAVGYKVKKKTGMDTWTIKSISTASMSYDSVVELSSEEGEEVKTLKGATLQSGYTFLSGSEEEEKARTTHLITVNIAGIARYEARTRNRPGSRVHFMDKVINVVAESYDEIKELIKNATPAKQNYRVATAPFPAEQVDA